MTKRNKSRRGFSLVELTIAMAVTLTLMSTIATLLVCVINERKRAVEDYDISSELVLVKNYTNGWFNDYVGYGEQAEKCSFALFSDEDFNSGVNVKNGGTVVDSLTFNSENKTLSSATYGTVTFSYIDGISFTVYDNVIKLSVSHRGCAQPTILILSRKDFSDEG